MTTTSRIYGHGRRRCVVVVDAARWHDPGTLEVHAIGARHHQREPEAQESIGGWPPIDGQLQGDRRPRPATVDAFGGCSVGLKLDEHQHPMHRAAIADVVSGLGRYAPQFDRRSRALTYISG